MKGLAIIDEAGADHPSQPFQISHDMFERPQMNVCMMVTSSGGFAALLITNGMSSEHTDVDMPLSFAISMDRIPVSERCSRSLQL